jgi:type VI protein secretion system component VasK
MNGIGFILFAAIFWVAPIFVAKRIGDGKGRTSSWAWGLLLGWIGVIVVALQSNRTLAAAAAPMALSASKQCPECAEQVQVAANVCKHCGFRFEGASQPA